jgi:hypothetical protein
MRSLPKNNESAKPTIYASSSNSTIMASVKVGNGFGRTIADNSRELQIRSSCGRLFHQVGGSEGISEYHCTNSSKILLAKHNLHIWSPKGINCGQRKTVRLLLLQGILQDTGHSCDILFSLPSTVYWGYRKGERANLFGDQEVSYDQKKGKWIDELPKVIWSHNTTVPRSIGFTPFRLLFGTEAMAPKEIKNESLRVPKAKEIEEVDM